MKKNIGIMASGGDAPGMNACIYYLAKNLIKEGFNPVFIEGGYQGLCENKFVQIPLDELRFNINRGGCLIRAGRSSTYLTEIGRQFAKQSFDLHKLECIIVIGGNGSFKGMLDGQPYGLKYIGIPATIGNDIFYTDYSLGFDSSANANIALIKAIKASCYSQSKLPIVEIMGRDCGKLAFEVAVGSGSDFCIVKEMPTTTDEVAKKVKKLLKSGQKDIVIVASERNLDLNELAEKLKNNYAIEPKVFTNSYAQRGVDASSLDRMLAGQFALEATKLVKNKEYFKVVGVKHGQAFSMPVEKALKTKSNFDIDLYKNMFC